VAGFDSSGPVEREKRRKKKGRGGRGGEKKRISILMPKSRPVGSSVCSHQKGNKKESPRRRLVAFELRGKKGGEKGGRERSPTRHVRSGTTCFRR